MLSIRVLTLLIGTVALAVSSPENSQKVRTAVPPQVWDFEQDAPGVLESAWIYPKERGVRVQIVSEGAAHGQQCAVLNSGIDRKLAPNGGVVINEGGFFLVRRLCAAPYRGKKIRLSAWLKLEALAYGAMGTGHLLLEVQRKGKPANFSDDQMKQPLQATSWTEVKTEAEVDADAEQIVVGARLLNGYGRLWVDDVKVEIVP